MLVVDDQPYTRDVVATILRHIGDAVQTAATVREGLLLIGAAPVRAGLTVPDQTTGRVTAMLPV